MSKAVLVWRSFTFKTLRGRLPMRLVDIDVVANSK